ncbi:hypothetical protein BDR07DRAFT_1480392 [Suillus spraguei]|nr:hypothetical protein BDR07DRAFT_1480392 [Suillus spraguei]
MRSTHSVQQQELDSSSKRRTHFSNQLDLLYPIIETGGSYPAVFDNVLELFIVVDSVVMLPKAWEGNESMYAQKHMFHSLAACIQELWYGPALFTFSDEGRIIDNKELKCNTGAKQNSVLNTFLDTVIDDSYLSSDPELLVQGTLGSSPPNTAEAAYQSHTEGLTKGEKTVEENHSLVTLHHALEARSYHKKSSTHLDFLHVDAQH